MFKRDVFLHELRNKYGSKTLILQKIQGKAQFAPIRSTQVCKYTIFVRAGFVMQS